MQLCHHSGALPDIYRREVGRLSLAFTHDRTLRVPREVLHVERADGQPPTDEDIALCSEAFWQGQARVQLDRRGNALRLLGSDYSPL